MSAHKPSTLSKREFRKSGSEWIVRERFYSPTTYPNLKSALIYMSARNAFAVIIDRALDEWIER